MRLNIVGVAFCMLFVALLINLYRTDRRDVPDANAGRMIEMKLRSSVTYSPRPPYPSESAKKGSQGVVVAAVRIGPDGTVQSVNVLEAPDQPIAESVARTVSQWRFKEPLPDGIKKLLAEHKLRPELKTLPFDSRLTFYFRLVNGNTPVVNNPDEIEGWRSNIETQFTAEMDRTNTLGQPIPER